MEIATLFFDEFYFKIIERFVQQRGAFDFMFDGEHYETEVTLREGDYHVLHSMLVDGMLTELRLKMHP